MLRRYGPSNERDLIRTVAVSETAAAEEEEEAVTMVVVLEVVVMAAVEAEPAEAAGQQPLSIQFPCSRLR